MIENILSQISQILDMDWMGISLSRMAMVLLAVLIGFFGKRIIIVLLTRLEKAASRTESAWDDIMVGAIKPVAGWASVLAGIYVAVQFLQIPTEPINVSLFVDSIMRGLFSLLLIWMSIRLTDRLCEIWTYRAERTSSVIDDQAIPIVRRSLRVFIVLVGGTLFLHNMGYSVASLLAGLGIGGAALAFASKDTLANLFGAIVIFVDRPFFVGDWIEIGGVEGTVEEVGLRTTRIRTFANSQITLPNSELSIKAINNWSRMKKRRIKMTVGVSYDASAEQMEQAVTSIREIIADDERMLQDFYLVNFDSFGASSLEIFIYCFTQTTDWAEYLAVKQDFLLAIMRRLSDLGLDFAFPTQTVHLASMPGEPAAMQAERPQ